jgi:hypothetical protein
LASPGFRFFLSPENLFWVEKGDENGQKLIFGYYEKIMKTVLIPKILSKIGESEYSLFDPGEVDERIFLKILKKYELVPEKEVFVLPYGEFNRVGFTTLG